MAAKRLIGTRVSPILTLTQVTRPSLGPQDHRGAYLLLGKCARLTNAPLELVIRKSLEDRVAK
jgi:hypothetical protein